MAVQTVTLGELKQAAPQLKGAAAAPKNAFNYAPMFLPVDATEKKGQGVVKVVTRQKFLDENIGVWVKWNAYKGTALMLGVVALFLLPTSIYLSGAAALGAGYCYGQFKRNQYVIEAILQRRWLLEGT
jgi:hypothetical protein